MSGGWWCDGVRWPGQAPELGWSRGGDRRVSVLAYGAGIGFRALGERHCVGARGNVCPLGAAVPGRSTGGRCAECARLDRAHSVAADTMADDPRTYRVYLAWFGPGMVKVGITGEERGAARLREQGAVVFSWLGRGPLMAARRTEEVLRAALGVPDRISYARKRAVRGRLPGAEERAVEVAELYGRAARLEGGGLASRWSGCPSKSSTRRSSSGSTGRPLPSGRCGNWSTGASSRGGSSRRPDPICIWRWTAWAWSSWTRG